MKSKFTLLAFLLVVFFAVNAQQVPNSSFDNWASPFAPDGWTSYDAIFGMNLGLCNKDTVDKIYGPASVKVSADSVAGFESYGVVNGAVILGSGSANPQPSFSGIPFTYKPDTLFVAYKYTSPGTDTAGLLLRMTNGGTGIFINGYNTIGLPLDTTSQWALIYSVITSFYGGSTSPDTLLVQFVSSYGDPIKGSTLHVDAVLFGYVNPPLAIKELAEKLSVTVYPNPAADVINISSSESMNDLKVYITDVTGKIAGASELNGTTTSINVSNLANGTYIYRIADKTGNLLKSGQFSVTK